MTNEKIEVRVPGKAWNIVQVYKEENRLECESQKVGRGWSYVLRLTPAEAELMLDWLAGRCELAAMDVLDDLKAEYRAAEKVVDRLREAL